MAVASLGRELSLADLFDEADADWRPDGQTDIAPHVDYQRDIIGWARDRLGVDERTLRWSMYACYEGYVWDGTPDPFAATAQAIEQYDTNGVRAVGVESGTTTGKTFFAAVLVLWFLACFPDSIVITVAPKEDQLRYHVWKNITKLWPAFQRLFPTASKDTLRIQMREGSDVWGAIGFVCGVRADEIEGSATKAQGFHAEHMLILFEEMPGIASAITEAFKNTCRAPHNIRVGLGNPNHQLDALHTFCIAPGSRHIIISALDHPNIVAGDAHLIPGAVSRIGIQSAKDEDGEDSPMFLSRVRGISPAQASDALIKLEWLQACAAMADDLTKLSLKQGAKALGVDVANSENGDKAAVSLWQGAHCQQVVAKACPSSNKLGAEVWEMMQKKGIEPAHVGIDPIGVGAGAVNVLDEHCDARFMQRVVRCNNGAKAVKATTRAADGSLVEWAPDANRFENFRAQSYWQLREDVRLGRIILPDDSELFRQLTIIRFSDDNGVVKIEPKSDIKRRLGKSPDEADCVVMGNWVRQRTPEPVPVPVGEDVAPAREALRVRRTAPLRHTTPRPAFQGWRPA